MKSRRTAGGTKLCKTLVFVQGEMVDIFSVTGLNILLCFPVSLVLLDSDINTYSSRRGRRINPESAEHGIVDVTGILGSTGSSDGCSSIVLALILELIKVAAEETGEGRNDDRKVAHGQGNASLKGTDNSLPNAREANDEDGMSEGSDGGGQGAGENRDQTESDGRGDTNVSEDPEGGDNQENVREGFG